MLMAAALVKISSPGPVLFRQKRVGLKGIVFTMFKFRSMTVERPDKSRGMTRAGDARITPVGRILRKWKIDELPQLWNVIRGEMSLVGPRPYLAEYFGSLSPAQRQIFRVRPAVTGAATLCYRNEEHCLAAIPEAELRRYYLTHLLPEKLEMDLQYMRVASIWSDLRILLGTARVLLAAVNKPPEVTPLEAPISDTQRAA
jgi:lipopolysaccharide/colanic/teichoic acid biosynthesis glycosyltransferase